MMFFRRSIVGLLLIVPLVFGAAHAVEPNERLDDPVLEQRAREISKKLRCLVCQNETIDESNADLARDLRILVRERIKAGASDQEVIDFVVSRYGDFVLLSPPFKPATVVLWFFPPVALIFGIGLIVLARKRRQDEDDRGVALTAEEEEALSQIVD